MALKYVLLGMFVSLLTYPSSNAEHQGGIKLPFLDMGPMIKSVASGINEVDNQTGVVGILDMLNPKAFVAFSTTTPAPETTLDPVDRLAHTIKNNTKSLLRGPAEAMNHVISGGFTIGQKATEHLSAAAKISSPLISLPAKKPPTGPEDEDWFYDSEYQEDRQYFSRDCEFRIACEVGRLMKPVADSFKEPIGKNKFLRDLQNKYTKAATYGILYDKCEKYFCLFTALIGGPTQFASAAVEIAKSVASPESR